MRERERERRGEERRGRGEGEREYSSQMAFSTGRTKPVLEASAVMGFNCYT